MDLRPICRPRIAKAMAKQEAQELLLGNLQRFQSLLAGSDQIADSLLLFIWRLDRGEFPGSP
ncbi:hypothetical protein FHX15_005313 [Rhizobium sp. BK650]|nr:hypothetical protein [Rhizobium sp. BK650]